MVIKTFLILILLKARNNIILADYKFKLINVKYTFYLLYFSFFNKISDLYHCLITK